MKINNQLLNTKFEDLVSDFASKAPACTIQDIKKAINELDAGKTTMAQMDLHNRLLKDTPDATWLDGWNALLFLLENSICHFLGEDEDVVAFYKQGGALYCKTASAVYSIHNVVHPSNAQRGDLVRILKAVQHPIPANNQVTE